MLAFTIQAKVKNMNFAKFCDSYEIQSSWCVKASNHQTPFFLDTQTPKASISVSVCVFYTEISGWSVGLSKAYLYINPTRFVFSNQNINFNFSSKKLN